jgi:outer membrane protein with beta-barrel domain
MNCKPRTSSLSAAVLSLFAAGAGAAEPGFYVTASLGQGDENPSSAGANFGNSEGIFHADPDSVDVDDGDLAWSVGLGYRINKYLSAEVEYVDFGTTDVIEHYSVDTPGAPVPLPADFDLDYASHVTGPVLSLLGALPVGENFELFLRGGALFASREFEMGLGGLNENFSSTVWLAGGGVTWSFAKRWAIRVEYQQTGEISESFISGETSLKRMSLTALFKLGG